MASGGKVGVLTFHRCFNYGSYWQARCLVRGLQALGHDAELLDHDCEQVNRAEGRCLMQPALPVRSRRTDLPHYKRKGRRFIDATGALPLSRSFSLHRPEALAERYAAIVVGSDEVWNFQHPWYGGKAIFFGGGLPAGRLVSYAASFGNHDADRGIGGDWSARLRDFAAISVRDANSSRLVEGALGAEPALVLDPCLQFPEQIEAEPAAGERYALVYGHGFPEPFAAAVRAWSAETGIRLRSIGYRNDWADEQRLDAGPLEFARAMAGAEAVITNFFHGCVFAIVNRKPLVTVPTPYRFNKVRDLAAALGLQGRVVDPSPDVRQLRELLASAPAAPVYRRIDELRAGSTAFLRAALA